MKPSLPPLKKNNFQDTLYHFPTHVVATFAVVAAVVIGSYATIHPIFPLPKRNNFQDTLYHFPAHFLASAVVVVVGSYATIHSLYPPSKKMQGTMYHFPARVVAAAAVGSDATNYSRFIPLYLAPPLYF